MEKVAISLEAANDDKEPKALNGTVDFTIYEFKKDDPNFEVLCENPPAKKEQKRFIYDKEDADKFFIKWEEINSQVSILNREDEKKPCENVTY